MRQACSLVPEASLPKRGPPSQLCASVVDLLGHCYACKKSGTVFLHAVLFILCWSLLLRICSDRFLGPRDQDGSLARNVVARVTGRRKQAAVCAFSFFCQCTLSPPLAGAMEVVKALRGQLPPTLCSILPSSEIIVPEMTRLIVPSDQPLDVSAEVQRGL